MPDTRDSAAASPYQAGMLLAGLAAASVLAVLAGLSSEMLLLAGLAGAAAVVLLPAAPWVSIAFFGAALGLRTPMNFHPLRAGGFRFYGGDFLLYLVGAAVLFTFVTAALGKKPALFSLERGERRVVLLLVALTGWGVVSMATGVMNGCEIKDILGDFRRFFIYSWALLPPLCLATRRRHLEGVKLALLGGCGIAFLFGLYRLVTGRYFYPNDEINIFPRLLADDEIVSLALLLAYLTAFLMADRPRPLKLAALAFAAAAAGLMCFSGWRMGIAQALLAPMLAVVITARNRGRGIAGIVLRLSLVGVILVAGTTGIFFALSDRVGHVMFMFQERLTTFGMPLMSDEDTRYYAYREALSRYADHPLLGRGLGDPLSYPKKTTTGTFLIIQGTTHNIFLDMLYQTGPAGLGLFLALHASFALHFLRRIRHVARAHEPVAVGLFAGYLCTMAHYCYEPAWVSGMIVLYYAVGFALVFLRGEPEPEAEDGTKAADGAPA